MATRLAIVVPIPKGTWNSTSSYNLLNIVTHEGRGYICKQAGTGVQPTPQGNPYWQLVADKGESFTFDNLTQEQKDNLAQSANAAANEAKEYAQAVKVLLDNLSGSDNPSAALTAQVAKNTAAIGELGPKVEGKADASKVAELEAEIGSDEKNIVLTPDDAIGLFWGGTSFIKQTGEGTNCVVIKCYKGVTYTPINRVSFYVFKDYPKEGSTEQFITYVGSTINPWLSEYDGYMVFQFSTKASISVNIKQGRFGIKNNIEKIQNVLQTKADTTLLESNVSTLNGSIKTKADKEVVNSLLLYIGDTEQEIHYTPNDAAGMRWIGTEFLEQTGEGPNGFKLRYVKGVTYTPLNGVKVNAYILDGEPSVGAKLNQIGYIGSARDPWIADKDGWLFIQFPTKAECVLNIKMSSYGIKPKVEKIGAISDEVGNMLPIVSNIDKIINDGVASTKSLSIDEANIKTGVFINSSTGEEVANAYRKATDYLTILGYDIVEIVYYGTTTGQGYAIYDYNKNYIVGGSESSGTTHREVISIPNNAAYIRFTTTEDSYFCELRTLEKDGLLKIAKSAYENNVILNDNMLENTINVFFGKFVDGRINLTTGNIIEYKDWIVSEEFIPVERGKTYYFSKYINGKRNYAVCSFARYNSDKQLVEQIGISANKYTVEEGVKYIKVSFSIGDLGIADIESLHFMIAAKDSKSRLLAKRAAEYDAFFGIPYEEYGKRDVLDISKIRVGNLRTKKRLACFGDSITMYGMYPEYAAYLTGMELVGNFGVGGCWLTKRNDYWNAFSAVTLADSIASGDWSIQEQALPQILETFDITEMLNALKQVDFNNVDVITFAFGTNDYNNSAATEGAVDGFDLTTYRGAINHIVRTIKSVYKHIQIVFICSTYRVFPFGHDNGGDYQNSTYNNPNFEDSDTWENTVGLTLKEVVDIVEGQAHLNHVDCLNMYSEMGINKYSYLYYLIDGTHLTYDGYREYGRRLAGYLLSH